MKLLGLVGAHRTGKTTLANILSNDILSKIPISISEMQAEIGYDSAKQDYTFAERVEIQEHLLISFKKKLNSFTGLPLRTKICTRVSERTPLDLIGYATVNLPDSPTQDQLDWLNSYADACIRLTNKFYHRIVLVQPGIEYVPCKTSAQEDLIEPLNAVYLHTILKSDLTVKSMILDRKVTDLDTRIKYIKEFIYG